MSELDTAPDNTPLQPKGQWRISFLIKKKSHVSGVHPYLSWGGQTQEQPEA